MSKIRQELEEVLEVLRKAKKNLQEIEKRLKKLLEERPR
jgi:exonuclease VII small subunit